METGKTKQWKVLSNLCNHLVQSQSVLFNYIKIGVVSAFFFWLQFV